MEDAAPGQASETPSEAEPELEAEPETPSDDVPAGLDETPSDTPDDEPESYRKALEKHKGDRSKLGDDYFQKLTQNAELTRQLQKAADEREALLEAIRRGKPEPEPESVAEPPELTEYDSMLESLEEQRKELGAAKNETIDEYRALEVELAVAKRDLEDADPLDKKSIQSQITSIQRQQKVLKTAYITQNSALLATDREIRRVGQDRRWAEDQLDSARENQQHAAETRTEQARSYSSWVKTTTEQELKAAGVPEAKLQYAEETIRAHLAFEMMSEPPRPLGDPTAQADHKAIIKAQVDRYVREHGIKRAQEFREDSARRRQTTRTAAPRTVPAAPGKPSESDPFAAARRGFIEGVNKRLGRAG
jgi:hypothetical protein